MLTEKQQKVVDLILKRENVMISGPGGTGKSFLIHHVVSLKDSLMSSKSHIMGVTAMTGAAAVLINGTTLHSFLGLGLGEGSVSQLVDKIKINNKSSCWKLLQILIIDEVSMLSVELFDKLERIARIFRENEKPFGGIHLVLSGDFLQLPCIGGEFCFKSAKWKSCIPKVICFDEILRQTDPVFHEILNRARFGKTTKRDIKDIKSKCLQKISDHSNQEFAIKPTMLLCKRADTDIINNAELKKIRDVCFYKYEKTVVWQDKIDQKILKALGHIPNSVTLCVGAQVMLTVNLKVDEHLVNGSRGVIVGFSNSTPIVQFVEKQVAVDLFKYTIEKNNMLVVSVSQIPLQLAYALTIHKSLGATLDCAHINFAGVFAYGQGYVALSRVKNLKSLYVENIKTSSFIAHPEALHFYENI
jgi:ATP-dependent DNA helicase PIF1